MMPALMSVRARLLLSVIAFFLLLVGMGAWFADAAWWSQPDAGAPVTVAVERGMSYGAVRNLLASEGLVVSIAYDVYARLDPLVQKPKAGTYDVRRGMSYRDIAQLLASGQTREEVTVRIIEGKTMDDEASVLKALGVDPAAFYALAGEAANAAPFDASLEDVFPFLEIIPQGMSLEGYLFPDTYRVWKDDILIGTLRKQLNEFQTRIIEPYGDAQAASGMTWHQLVTLASIVEAEVQKPEDRRVVAGIFLNRMNNGMRLQSDATVNYVTRAGRTRPTLDDLATDSPYNTYQRDGLPPGPVSNPSLSALHAVLDPVKSDYHYFLTDPQGKVYYARTYDEHLRNKANVYGS